ncbi:MAG TPA: anti-sigma factor antagonist [Candidatus Hydrogenedens sp.]|nr:anti-sigma factor antagonist [Candidatus Hydrogenedens sp.]HOK08788.1 anti-sigma factor antagonist [Candidatus Hydrogenedens sp.]HOL20643.1 anti-sigma factor antagonist [Candidatus Hydrogenedens sp.]HPP58477.1 anti-sigma factor antagonist [Candidatus Hydrogenedens sp.]
MEIEKVDYGHVILIRASGELDEKNMCELRLIIADYIRHKRNHVVVNMHDVEMMDMEASGYLLECLQMARRKGGDLKLVSPAIFVEQLFRFLGIWHYFEIYPNEKNAIDAFKLVA